jgi:hypothetical protein
MTLGGQYAESWPPEITSLRPRHGAACALEPDDHHDRDRLPAVADLVGDNDDVQNAVAELAEGYGSWFAEKPTKVTGCTHDGVIHHA